jgi:UDP-glucose 4-epimerase
MRDFTDAPVAGLEWLAAGNPSESLNLGNGRGFSVAEIVTADEVARRPAQPGDSSTINLLASVNA